MTTPGLESDPSNERMEDAPRGEAHAGTAGGSSATAPGDEMPAPPDVGVAASSLPGVGPATPRSALSFWIYPNWPICLYVFTCERFSLLREAMLQVWRRITRSPPAGSVLREGSRRSSMPSSTRGRLRTCRG